MSVLCHDKKKVRQREESQNWMLYPLYGSGASAIRTFNPGSLSGLKNETLRSLESLIVHVFVSDACSIYSSPVMNTRPVAVRVLLIYEYMFTDKSRTLSGI